ncbi:MAG TPA: dUTP diphosphatase [Bacteroidota bacterium]|nr:dUTP diphosphatase [Bacteroidota bacterium]
MAELTVRISRTSSSVTDIPLPHYATEGSAGMDIRAAVTEDTVIRPGETVLIPTGFSVEIPPGYEAQVRPRSGLAIKNQVGVLNAPGTIDSDYRGEVKVILTNFGKVPFVVKRGERIAQMVVASCTRVSWQEVDALDGTKRGGGGFGHTGS